LSQHRRTDLALNNDVLQEYKPSAAKREHADPHVDFHLPA
jgi:hypothetical protein